MAGIAGRAAWRRAFGAAIVLVALVVPGSAWAALTEVSSDPYANPGSQHRTEVEPDTFAFGSTLVGAFQVGRFSDGGASNVGWVTRTDSGSASGFLPGTTGLASPTGPYSRLSDPTVAFDARHGVWLIASIALDAATNGVAVLVSRSMDGGSSWSAPVAVVTATGTANLDKDWIVCDNTPSSVFYGNCYVAWDDFGDADRLKMSTSHDGGATWAAPRNTGGNATGLGGQPVVRPDGVVIVPAANADESAIIAFRSTDGGVSWTTPVTVSPVSAHPPADNLRAEALPSAEIDGAGRVYVAWQDCRFRTGCTANDIVLSTSDDGTTWSAPARVPIDPTTSNSDHFIPGLGVDAGTSGTAARLALTYYFYPAADCPAATCQLDVGSITSADGGASWSAPAQVAGPMSVSWLASTTQGAMVGDYISTSFVAGTPRALIAVARAPSGGVLDEAIDLLEPDPPASPSSPPETTPPAGAPPTPARPAPRGSPASAPKLAALSLAPRSFVAARSGASIAAIPGTRVTYRALAAASTTGFVIERAARGERTGGRCVKPNHRHRGHRACTRWVRVHGSFAHRDRAGVNRFRFTGRLAGRALTPAAYRLLATPRDAAGRRGTTLGARFRILAPHQPQPPASAR